MDPAGKTSHDAIGGAAFTRMQDSTADDWRVIGAEFAHFSATLPDRVLAHLRLLDGDYGGFPVDRLTHSLQTATLAANAGRSDEYIVCALLHDIGDTLGSFNHPDIAAAILKPFVSEENHWIVEQHGIFQGYYFFHHIGLDRDLREQYRDHPWFDAAAEFCAEYDAPAFDPQAETFPLSDFEPMVRRVLAKPLRSIYKAPNTDSAPRLPHMFESAGPLPGRGVRAPERVRLRIAEDDLESPSKDRSGDALSGSSP